MPRAVVTEAPQTPEGPIQGFSLDRLTRGDLGELKALSEHCE